MFHSTGFILLCVLFCVAAAHKHKESPSNARNLYLKFTKMIQRYKRTTDSSIVAKVSHCQSSQCRDALNGATCALDLYQDVGGFSTGVYICNGVALWSVNIGASCMCNKLLDANETVNSIVVDRFGINWLSEDGQFLVTLTNTSVTKSSLSGINQEHQDAVCNLFSTILLSPSLSEVNGSRVLLNISTIFAATTPPTQCTSYGSVNLTVATYSTLHKRFSASDCFGSSDCIENDVGNHPIAVLSNLSPNTSYQIQIATQRLFHNSRILSLSQQLIVNTSCGVSSEPTNLRCHPLSFNEIQIVWEPPMYLNTPSVEYQVLDVNGIHQIPTGSLYFSKSTQQTLHYQVRVFPIGCPSVEGLYSSSNITCPPFEAPKQLSIEHVTSNTITVTWNPYPPGQISNIVVLWSLRSERDQWIESLPLDGSATSETITDLIADTGYVLKSRVTYVSGRTAEAPGQVGADTLPGPPHSPTNVTIKGETPDGVLCWYRPLGQDDSRSDIKEYVIEARNRSAPDSHRELFGPWRTVTVVNVRAERRWTINNLTQDEWYEFRVYAVNEAGRGDTSAMTSPYQFTLPVDDSRYKWIVIGSSLGTAFFVLIIILAFVCYKCSIRRRRKRLRKQLPGEIATIHINYGMDMELAQIRHMTSLAMAAASNGGRINLPDDYMKKLPLFPRDKLTLDILLGSGAFGEVYKGIAIDIKGGEAGIEYPVAVKTLKDGASDSEKCEFLMEAYFMSLFDHPNIISLLGVCLDNEPQFLILELMEGGDLLKYLRQARPTQILSAKLQMLDLLDICLDLAAGCQYLETQHFIHRDLAARNCLVSTKAFRTNNRVVKIGDFGLARDIYRNDYYHKEGEGLLPVRWMAPENLTLKIYTVQSDVWAFGVLLWEVMTFGQQPYPAFTNLEVIHYVKDGGRLERPSNCPDVLYAIMMKCWSMEPAERPAFQEVLQTLQNCKVDLSALNSSEGEIPKTGNGAVNYSTMSPNNEDSVFESRPVQYFDNRAFEFDEGEGGNADSRYAAVSFSSPSYETGSFRLEPASTPYTNNFIRRSSTSSVSEIELTIPKRSSTSQNINYAQLGFLGHSDSVIVKSPDSSNFVALPKDTARDTEVVECPENQYVRTPIQASTFEMPEVPQVNNNKQDTHCRENGSVRSNGHTRSQSARSSAKGASKRRNRRGGESHKQNGRSSTRLNGRAYVNDLTRHWDDDTGGENLPGNGANIKGMTYL